MAKKSAAHMTHFERVAGTVFFAIYFLVLPLTANRLFAFCEMLLGSPINETVRNTLYYYILFAVTLLIFYRYLLRTTARLLDNLDRTLSSIGVGLLVFYGANELLYRVFHMLFDSRTNLNDTAIAAQISAAPRLTALIIVLLSPFVEEVLFRGLVFGSLRQKSRVAAYSASCILFAFIHVWTFALSSGDAGYLTLMLQYFVPGIIFSWVYDHSGTLWASILLHAAVNALSLWTILG